MGAKRRGHMLWAALLMLLSLTLGGARIGYAGAEPPSGTEEIPRPKMMGEFVALLDTPTGNVVFSIVGTCKGHQFIIGPLFAPDFPVPFEVATSEAGLVNFFIGKNEFPELIHVPAQCFPDQDEVVGFVVDQVVRYIAQTPTVVVARVVLLGVRPETP